MHVVGIRWMARHGPQVAALAILDLAIVLGFAAHMTGGLATGASSDSDPVALLGTTLVDGTCPSIPVSAGEGRTVVCPTWTGVTSPAGVIRVVSVYGPGNAVVDDFGGPLPRGLHWGDEVKSVWATLGQPSRVTSMYGTPTLVYMFTNERYGSLELQFDAADHLMRVNASLLH